MRNVDTQLKSAPIQYDQTQRTALVTGGTGGIGAAVALQLAAAGDRVIIVGRNQANGDRMLRQMRAASNLDHRFIAADLSLLSEAARVTDEVRATVPRLDAGVFCAGILSTIPEWTSEGLERNFVLNYLSRYLMVRKLLPHLEAAPSGRVVLVSNAGMYGDTLDFDDLQHRTGRPGLKVAGRTQFANDLLAVELGERLRGSSVAVSCVFPGFVRTGVFANAVGLPWIFRALMPLIALRQVAPDVGAATPVQLARSKNAAYARGQFFGPGMKQLRIPPRVLQADRLSGLWTRSEDLVRAYLD
jgi:NAD(P)-dependent dehydrogenase (short-subunit alcohol dehydrogenase family)